MRQELFIINKDKEKRKDLTKVIVQKIRQTKKKEKLRLNNQELKNDPQA